MDKEYLGIAGLPAFNKAAAELAFGDNSSVLKDKRVRCFYDCQIFGYTNNEKTVKPFQSMNELFMLYNGYAINKAWYLAHVACNCN